MLLVEKLCKLMRYVPVLILSVSILGFVATLYLMTTGRMSSTSTINFLFVVSALTSGAYILFDKLWSLRHERIMDVSESQYAFRHCPPCFHRILDISFWIGYCLLLLVVFFNDVHRPLYMLVLSVVVGILIFKLFVSNTKTNCLISLLKALILLSLTSLSIFKTYYWIGRDSWKHATWNINIAENGILSEELGKEFATPLHHVLVAMSDLILGIDVRDATLIVVSLSFLILFSLAVFIITRKIVDDRYAVIAVIISGYIGTFAYWVGQGVTTTYAYAIFATLLILLYGILFSGTNKKIREYSYLFLFIVLVLALSHLFSSFMVFLFLCGVIMAYIFLRMIGFISNPIGSMCFIFCGAAILVVYTLFTQFSLMESVFTVAFTKLFEIIGQFSPIGAVSAGALSVLLPSDVFSSLVSSIDSAGVVSLIDSYLTIVKPTLIDNIRTMGLEFAFILIPFILSVCFASKCCFRLHPTKYQIQYLYVLAPFLTLFVLFGVTSVAYPPMSARPEAFLLLPIGILISCILWYYIQIRGSSKISLMRLVVIVLVVLCMVVPGSIIASNNVGLSTESDSYMVSTGYSYPEIDGLFTVVNLIPKNSILLVDYEMTDAQLLNFVSTVTQSGYVIPYLNMLTYSPVNIYDNGYLLFRQSLVNEATYSTTQTGNSELTIIWDKYNIDLAYPELMGSINSVIYENGELILFEV